MAQQPLVYQGLVIEDSRSHSDTPLLWTSDQTEAETRYNTHETDIHSLRRDSKSQSQQARGRRPAPYTARPLEPPAAASAVAAAAISTIIHMK